VHFENVDLGAFIVMPNHVHGIVILREMPTKQPPPVGARHVVPLPPDRRAFGESISGSLGTIVQQYKSSVARQVRRRVGGETRLWQRNYCEHILRNDEDWQRMHLYIESNPANWDADDGNPGNVGRFPPCSP